MLRATARFAFAMTMTGLLAACPQDSSTPSEPAEAKPAEPAEPAEPAASTCPAPTDGCMNEDNHKACLAAEAKCPGKVRTMESCPLQFGC